MQKLHWSGISDRLDYVHLGLYNQFPPLSSRHTHDFFEIFFLLEGQLTHLIGVESERQELATGHLVLIRPEDIHGFARTNAHDCRMVNLAFTEQTYHEVLQFSGLVSSAHPLRELSVPPRTLHLPEAEMQAIDEQLTILVEQPPQQANPALRVIIARWLCELVYPVQAAVSMRPSWLNELIEAMRRKKNFLQGIEHLHKLAARSPEHVARTFRQYLGLTPSAFLNDLKLAYASQLLREDTLPVIEVALEAGFSEPTYFSRLFRQKYQCTPKEYRQRAQRTLP